MRALALSSLLVATAACAGAAPPAPPRATLPVAGRPLAVPVRYREDRFCVTGVPVDHFELAPSGWEPGEPARAASSFSQSATWRAAARTRAWVENTIQ